MNKRINLVLFLLGFGVSMFAVTQNDSIKNKLQTDSITIGKELYSNSCVRCHKLTEPSKYTAQQWPNFVDKMQKRSKITDAQKALIIKYLATEAKR